MPRRTPLPLLSTLALLSIAEACVIGRGSRASQSESAQGPLAPAVSGAPVVPQTLAEASDAPAAPGKPGAVWMQGYWHWDGVRYVWQRGHYAWPPGYGQNAAAP